MRFVVRSIPIVLMMLAIAGCDPDEGDAGSAGEGESASAPGSAGSEPLAKHEGALEAMSACCFPKGFCADLLVSECSAQGGSAIAGASCADGVCKASPPTPMFACCLPTGECAMLSDQECGANGGFLNDGDCSQVACLKPTPIEGVPINPIPIPVLAGGACCLPNGGCKDLDTGTCAQVNGMMFTGTMCGSQTECKPVPAGACCLPFGKCEKNTENGCTAQGGAFFGGKDCTKDLCGSVVFAKVGACCLPDGSCEELAECQCDEAGGKFVEGIQCDAGSNGQPICPLVNKGACCLPNGDCKVTSLKECAVIYGGKYTHGVSCEDVDCPTLLQPCCLPTGDCLQLSPTICKASAGVVLPEGSSCEGKCPAPEWACCLPGGDCKILSKFQCIQAGGVYHFGQTCDQVDCPVTGACCLPDGQCQQLTATECKMKGGSFTPGASCDGIECCPIPPDGPCCVVGNCYTVSQEICASVGGKWFSDSLTCDTVKCCGGASVACDDGIGAGESQPFNPKEGDGVGINGLGEIVLDSSKIEDLMLWVANSGEDTVSKIDTKTGKELARYPVCDDPSRTAVDKDNNCWVGCRQDGKVAKIMHEIGDCVDFNGNGTIQTSTDLNNDGAIQPAEMLPFGQDECVKFVANIGAGKIRAAGVDANNHAWVGDWNQSNLKRLDPNTGAVVQTISNLPALPYGLAIDGNGIIWVAGRGGKKLLRVDPTTSAVQALAPNDPTFEPYGIAIDMKGDVWMGNCCSKHVAFKYTPPVGVWTEVPLTSRPRGVAADIDGYVYVALDQSNLVAKINANTDSLLGYANLGANRFPVGVAVDADGYVWAINQTSKTASKVDVNTLMPVIETPVGANPYTYSDMTGYALKTVVSSEGTYLATFQGCVESDTQWLTINVNYTAPAGTHIEIRYRAANSLPTLATTPWSATKGPFPPATMPYDVTADGVITGLFMQVEVKLVGTNGFTPSVSSVQVTSGIP